MGFSAGGYLVTQTSNIFQPVYKPIDAIDNISSRPDFAIAFYPGHLCRSDATLDPGIRVTKNTPPTFLLPAWDDPVDDICNSTLYARALDGAGVPTEVHLFAKGGHPSVCGNRSTRSLQRGRHLSRIGSQKSAQYSADSGVATRDSSPTNRWLAHEPMAPLSCSTAGTTGVPPQRQRSVSENQALRIHLAEIPNFLF